MPVLVPFWLRCRFWLRFWCRSGAVLVPVLVPFWLRCWFGSDSGAGSGTGSGAVLVPLPLLLPLLLLLLLRCCCCYAVAAATATVVLLLLLHQSPLCASLPAAHYVLQRYGKYLNLMSALIGLKSKGRKMLFVAPLSPNNTF